ncbi:hypothetical protein [Flavobacterium adhaerens]|uniref:hypothetical protein n=1 Tax=Flavobacterium adhaerens TaxID=3149043 RepID=UPI0032B423B1
MFENVDDLIEVNLKLLYTSKSHYMMRINFKDEFGFNLKNSKAFAEILVSKGLVLLDNNQGFRCDLTELGKQIYEKGGWISYISTVDTFSGNKTFNDTSSFIKKDKQSLLKKIMIVSMIILVICIFISLITFEILKSS